MAETTRWFVVNGSQPLNLSHELAACKKPYAKVLEQLAKALTPAQQTALLERVEVLKKQGVDKALSATFASLPLLATVPDVVRLMADMNAPVHTVLPVYFGVAGMLELEAVRGFASALPAPDHWQQQAKLALLENLNSHQRRLTRTVLKAAQKETKPLKMLELWQGQHAENIARYRATLAEIRQTTAHPTAAMLSVLASCLKPLSA